MAYLLVHVGLDATGSNAVDSDALVAAVNRHAANKGLNGALGARVDGVHGHALGLAGDGAHEDDAAADGQVAVGLARDEELATGVDAEDAVKLFLGHILEVAEGDDTRVGDGNVELPVVRDGGVEQLDRLRDVGHVGLDGDGVAASGLDLGNYLLGRGGRVGVVDHDGGAAGCELFGDAGSNATAWEG